MNQQQHDAALKKAIAELQQFRFNQHDPEPVEQTVFRIQFKTIGGLGDVIAFSGRQKAGKSLFSSAAMAAAISRKEIFDMRITLPDAKNAVAHFDTEQSKLSHFKMMKRVKHFTQYDSLPAHFNSYRLRSVAPRMIMMYVEAYLKFTPSCGIVFIDGLLDLVDSMNDEKHSSHIKQWLKKISDDHNVLIVGIIHRGFASDKSIGQIGSAIDRIASAVMKIEKIKETKQIVMSSEYLRDDDEIEPIAVFYNTQVNEWQQTEFIEEPQEGAKRATNKRRPYEFNLSEHTANVALIFSNSDDMSYTDIVQRIVEVYGVGRNWAKECVALLQQQNLIYKTANGFTNRQQLRIVN